MSQPPNPRRTRGRAPGLAEDLRISIARLSRRLRTLRVPGGGGTGDLSLTQSAALAAIERNGSMTRVIAFLEERGMVQRSPHPTDGRQVVLRATEAGRSVLAETRRHKAAWLSRRLDELTPEERDILRRAAPILDKISRS